MWKDWMKEKEGRMWFKYIFIINIKNKKILLNEKKNA